MGSIDVNCVLQIGMKHDFEHGSHCNNTGLMSYGEPPDTWSTCSINDFIKWWRRTGFACELSQSPSGPTTLRPPTKAPKNPSVGK